MKKVWKKKNARIRDDEIWTDDQLRKFLMTLREQPVKEMNDIRNKWVMFSKRLEAKGVKKSNEQCRKKVSEIFTIM